ncbi:MAG TPA: TMEM165/GDT1 family protein [Candidatus Saccharimonadales bacterium]|nr:TMEM165/GDT1 family protein [Candidatus Saccharimonadales bacterium]
MHFDIGITALVFSIILVAELPDKSMFATLVLGSRLPALYVWLGAAAAFLVQVIIAVAAGKLLTLLPHRAMELVIAALFFGGALLLFFGKHGLEEESDEPKTPASHNPLKVFGTAFSIIFIGEWGDITQIATANYAAKYHDPLSVSVGATLGLWTAAGLAIVAGNKVLNLIPAKLLLRFMGLVMFAFAVLSVISAFK